MLIASSINKQMIVRVVSMIWGPPTSRGPAIPIGGDLFPLPGGNNTPCGVNRKEGGGALAGEGIKSKMMNGRGGGVVSRGRR